MREGGDKLKEIIDVKIYYVSSALFLPPPSVHSSMLVAHPRPASERRNKDSRVVQFRTIQSILRADPVFPPPVQPPDPMSSWLTTIVEETRPQKYCGGIKRGMRRRSRSRSIKGGIVCGGRMWRLSMCIINFNVAQKRTDIFP